MIAAPTALWLACAFVIATNTITKQTMNWPHMMGDSIDTVTTHNENPRQSESSSNLHVETNAKAARPGYPRSAPLFVLLPTKTPKVAHQISTKPGHRWNVWS